MFSATVTDAATNTFTSSAAIDVISRLGFDGTVPAMEEAFAYSFGFTVTGATGTVTWATSGSLPTGISINTSTGVLSGTPGGGTAGVYNFTVTASDAGTGDTLCEFLVLCDSVP